MARIILLFCLLFGQAMAQVPPQAASPRLEKAFLKDPDGQLAISQVLQARFQPYEGSLGLGFQPGAAWIRLQMNPPGVGPDAAAGQGAASGRWWVRVGPNYLERVELYVQDGAGWSRQLRGALTPQASRGCHDDMHCFVVEAPPSQAATVYLRIEHRGFLMVQVDAVSPDGLTAAVAERVRSLTLSLTMAVGMLLLGLALLLIDRSVLMLAYCGFQLSVVLFIASNAGLLSLALASVPAGSLSLFNHLLYVLRGGMTGLLAWAVLRPYHPASGFVTGGEGLMALCAANAVLLLSGQVQLALKGSLLVISLIPFWHLYGTLTARSLPQPQRRVLLAGALIYILMLLLGLWLAFGAQPIAPRTGLIRQIADWRLNGFAVGLLFFWITLMERSSQKRQRAQELEDLRLQSLEARARQAELDDRSGLIDMLTHELKNPLGTIRFALASLRDAVSGADGLKRIQSIDLSVRRMDDLIERVAGFSKVERTSAPDAGARVPAGGVLQELLPDVAQATQPSQWDIQVQPGVAFRCDRQLLGVILENLMSNADKYSVPGRPIQVRAAMDAQSTPESGPMVRVEISNHVEPSCVPSPSKIFDRYYRHPNVQAKPGMGLGLSVVKLAVQKIGGTIAYRHENGQVFFTLRVPA